MKIEDVHARLAIEILHSHVNEDDALALMILFHTHRIRLNAPVLDDRPGITEIAAITQRHAAEVMAAAWPDRDDSHRTDRLYWYYQFNSQTPYEVVDDVPRDWMIRVQRMRDNLSNVPMIRAIEPDD
jgi:hypothetical protein